MTLREKIDTHKIPYGRRNKEIYRSSEGKVISRQRSIEKTETGFNSKSGQAETDGLKIRGYPS